MQDDPWIFGLLRNTRWCSGIIEENRFSVPKLKGATSNKHLSAAWDRRRMESLVGLCSSESFERRVVTWRTGAGGGGGGVYENDGLD